MLLLFGLSTNTDYLHYTSELLPTLLLMVAFYIFVVWLDELARRPARSQLLLLLCCGLALGTAPWCKLQSGPIAVALGLVASVAIFRNRATPLDLSGRLKELIALWTGAILTSCIMLGVLIRTGATNEFWHSYVLENLAAAGPWDLLKSTVLLPLILLTWPMNQLLFVAMLGVAVRICASQGPNDNFWSRKRVWEYSGLVVYAAAAFLAISRAKFFFPHYAIFLVPPLVYLAALIADPGLLVTINKSGLRHRPLTYVIATLAVASAGLYIGCGMRYAHLIRAIEAMPTQSDFDPRTPKTISNTSQTQGGVQRALVLAIGPSRWEPEDSNERITSIVKNIQKQRVVSSLAIWGWTPGVYILTGMPPATRDSIGHFIISPGTMQGYFRARFLADMRSNEPDLFIDAVARDAFMWREWTENDSYESDPELRQFIDTNYVLVDELTLVEGAKPVRFFARRGTSDVR
jgi:hypothetical protein